MNYFRRFCKDYSSIASPLFKLAVVDKKNFIWTDEAQAAFDELKVRLSNPPILALPREDDTFILTTDAAEKGYRLCSYCRARRGKTCHCLR